MISACSPGSHSHSDQPNWQPADNPTDYLANCREGLEAYSDRRFAKLMGWSRAHVQRAQLMAKIPPDLFELLLKEGMTTTSLANVGAVLTGAENIKAVERCPHCGGAVRVRLMVNGKALEIVNAWLKARQP